MHFTAEHPVFRLYSRVLCLFVLFLKLICIIASKNQWDFGGLLHMPTAEKSGMFFRGGKYNNLLLSYSEFLQMAINFEECRKKWLQTDEELVSCKEVLAKAQTERGSLEVKLKHARNQVDVEIRRRQKAEAVYEKLVGATLLNLV